MTQTRRFLTIATLAAGAFLFTPASRAADEPKPAAATDAGDRVANLLKSARAKLDELNPTAEQKTKFDEIFANAETDLKKTFADAASLQPEERRQKMQEFMSALKDKIAATLTPEQKTKFDQMQFGLAAGGNRGQLGERLKETLEKLDLTDDQKAKVKPIMEDARKKMEELRAEAQSGDRAKVREKAMEVMQDVRTKLQDVLTPDQQQKFREMMQQARPGAAARKANENK